MSDTLELNAALADLVALSEKNAITFPAMVAAIKALSMAAPVVHVAAPVVHVAAPVVHVAAADTPPPVVHVVEPVARTTRLTVNRNPSGFIESLDITVLTEHT